MSKSEGAEFIKWIPHLLDALRSLNGAAKPKEVSNWIAKKLNFPPETTEATMKSGILRLFHNQVQWDRQYLVWEGLVGSSKYGIWNLTEKGEKTHLSDREARSIFLKWVRIHAERRNKKTRNETPLLDVEETIDEQELLDPESRFRASLLTTIRNFDPQGFERFITSRNAMLGRADKGIIFTTSRFFRRCQSGSRARSRTANRTCRWGKTRWNY